ncbi:hypothetical protein ScPMuIL_008421 [Solemya velum]
MREKLVEDIITYSDTLDDVCTKCGFFNDEGEGDIFWTECEFCGRWFHEVCVPYALLPGEYQPESDHFFCQLCLRRKTKKSSTLKK